MWGISDIVNNLARVPEPPAPQPPPPPPPPPVEVDSRRSELAQFGAQWRQRLENFFAPIVADLTEAAQLQQRVRQIAIENAPLLVLPTSNSGFSQLLEGQILPNVSQDNLLADPQAFIANSRLREDVPFHFESPEFDFWNGDFDPTPIGVNDVGIGDNTDDDPDNNFSPTDVGNVTNENVFLDLNNEMRGQLGSENAPVFYQFQAAEYDDAGTMTEPPRLTYHFFYAYNDAPRAGNIDFNHEGDWERVTYELDPQTLQPVTAILSAHEGGSRHPFNGLDRDPASGRPFIYVANGSHANYADSGIHPIEVFGAPVTFDRTSEREDAFIFDTAVNLDEVTSQPWYPNSGRGPRWGEIGALNNAPDVISDNLDHSSGPTGPSEYKGAVEP